MNDKELFKGVLPSTSFIHINPPVDQPQILYPQEKLYLSKMLSKRLMEFCGGRLCAKHALAELKIKQFPVLIDSHRRPIWPKVVVGSISHCNHLCIAAVDYKTNLEGLGVDLEERLPLDKMLVEYVCRPEEILALDNHTTALLQAKLIFSIKESIFKCLNPIYTIWIDFKDISIVFSADLKKAKVLLYGDIKNYCDQEAIRLNWIITEKYIFTAAWIESQHQGLTTE